MNSASAFHRPRQALSRTVQDRLRRDISIILSVKEQSNVYV